MSKEKPAASDTEQALRTLDQLSQTIEVMSEVVDRLKRHLRRQSRKREQRPETDAGGQAAATAAKSRIGAPAVELEISTERRETSRRTGRVIH